MPGIGDHLTVIDKHLPGRHRAVATGNRVTGVTAVAFLQQLILIAYQRIDIRMAWNCESVADMTEHNGNLPGRGIVDIRAVMGVDPFGLDITGRIFGREERIGLRIVGINNSATISKPWAHMLAPVGGAVDKAERYPPALEFSRSGKVEYTACFPIADQKTVTRFQIDVWALGMCEGGQCPHQHENKDSHDMSNGR